MVLNYIDTLIIHYSITSSKQEIPKEQKILLLLIFPVCWGEKKHES